MNDDFRLELLDSNKNLLYLVQGYHTSGRLSNRTGGFFPHFFHGTQRSWVQAISQKAYSYRLEARKSGSRRCSSLSG